MIVELKQNPWNTYEVLTHEEKYTKLKCKTFVRNEDLGDGILCTRQDQEIWIATYHWPRFQPAVY